MMAEGLKKVNEEEVDYPDGRHAHLETTKVPLRSQNGAILGLIGVSHDITDRKLAEARLAATEERSRLILDSVQDGVVGMDRDGRITFANPAAPAMLGYTTEELIGAQMHPLIHHSYPDGKPFPREDCSMYLTAIGGRARVVENEVLWRKDGRPLPVEYSTTPIQKDGELIGTVVVYRDITHR
jgi:PAS domain S-box-containing protein